MLKNRTSRSIATAALTISFILSQVTWALAGTTGNVSGTVTDEGGAPVSGVAIRAVSASQTAGSTTDSRGAFSFLNLQPDTYTLSVEKDGYNPISYSGVTVFADQTLTLSFKLTKALKTIAKVSARAAGNLVKPGTTSDVYSVNEATGKQLATAAGGYNLDSAYAAVASQPGVYQGVGSYNFGQVFYIRGSAYSQIGYEFDGVPVNRAFDNYNANSLSNLGAAQTEVYTGGSPAGASSATLGGYINQVIKTGTYPGYGDVTGAIGTPAFYHKLDFEGGGSTPDRLFSWYVGLRGSNNTPAFITSKNGADLDPTGNNKFGFQGYQLNGNGYVYNTLTGEPTQGPWSTCVGNGATPPAGTSTLNLSGFFGVTTPLPACSSYAPLSNSVAAGGFGAYGYQIQDRENVFNFHIGIPHHKDAGRDDIQLLYDNFSYHSIGWDNLNAGALGIAPTEAALAGWAGPNGYFNTWNTAAFGGGLTPGPQWNGTTPNLCSYMSIWAAFGVGVGCTPFGNSPGPIAYTDSLLFNGVSFGTPASAAAGKAVTYLFPSTPQNRPANFGIDPNAPGGAFNNGSIIKAQYTKNLGSNAFIRLFGYTFYSDWLQGDPNKGAGFGELYGFGFNPASGDYEVAYHTRGVQLQAADQINQKNLVTFTGNFTTSVGSRANNTQAGVTPSAQPAATLQNGAGQCFSGIANTNPATGLQFDASYPATAGVGTPVSCLSVLAGAYTDPTTLSPTTASVANVNAGAVIPSPVAGADWLVTQNLFAQSNVNRVQPRFSTLALQDEFRPSDRWDINAGVRYENYQYVIPNAAGNGGQFWANQINSTACVAPNGLVQVRNRDVAPSQTIDSLAASSGYTTYLTTAPGGACPFDPVLGQQTFHPGTNGIPAVVLPAGSTTLNNSTFSPRVGFTYTLTPDSVLRFTYGRYTEPTPTYAEEVLTYLDPYQQATKVYGSAYYNNGFSSTIHNNPIQYSNNWDLSFEHHFKGTDVSMKLSPFYRYTTGQVVSVALPGGLAGGFNAATQRSEGVEFQLQKGDPTRNGLSGQFSYTFTDARIKYGLINGANSITSLRTNLTTFWNLTANSGTAGPCFSSAAAGPNNPSGALNCNGSAFGSLPLPAGFDPVANAGTIVTNPYFNLLPNESLNSFLAQYPIDGWYPTYANYFPADAGGLSSAFATEDLSTAIPQHIFAGFLAYKHNKFQASLNAALQQGTRYGSPALIEGLNPTSCVQNQAAAGVASGGQLGDYQSCTGTVPVPNPQTGRFDAVAQFINPWIFNLGGQISYDFSPRVTATVSLANILNRCFGGSPEPWTAAYKPNEAVCTYSQQYNPWSLNPTYITWSPGEAYNTAGAGYFYGSSPADPANGTAGYPSVYNYPYTPQALTGYPFQAYFQLTVKI